jgi:hypothetical protein
MKVLRIDSLIYDTLSYNKLKKLPVLYSHTITVPKQTTIKFRFCFLQRSIFLETTSY